MGKTSIVTLAALAIVVSPAKAQVMQSAPLGNFIWATPTAPGAGPVTFWRKGPADRDFKKMAETTLPADRGELEKRITAALADFKHLPAPTVAQKDTLMRLIQAGSIPTAQRLKYDPVAMLAAGQAYYDKGVRKGEKVTYKITVGGGDRTVEAPAWPTVPALPLPVFQKADESSDGITLYWTMKGEPTAEGFIVYRRPALKGDFTPIGVKGGFSSKGKEWSLIVNDTATLPRSMYEYRAAALDKLGNEGALSAAAKARTRSEDVLPYFNFLKADVAEDGGVTLRWKLQMPQLARSINVYRSRSFDKDFKLIGRAAASDSTYADHTMEPNEDQYYRLEVLMDEGARESPVAFIVGKPRGKAPAPEILEAYAKDGQVTLRWTPVPDLADGYYVYRQTAIGAEPEQVSDLVPADSGSFTFKPGTAGERYAWYFTVRAAGKDHALSEASKPVDVTLHGASTVAAPTGLKARLSEGQAVITWDDLFAANDNIAGYVLTRKTDAAPAFVRMDMDTLDPRRTICEDTLVKPGNRYTYRLKVYDYYGASATAETVLDYPGIGIIPPQELALSLVPAGVHLSWGQTFQDVSAVRVYGHAAGEQPVKLAELDADATSWLHAAPAKGKTWSYSIAYVGPGGKESDHGPERAVRVK